MLPSRTKLNKDLFVKGRDGKFISRTKEEELEYKQKRKLTDEEKEMIDSFLRDRNENN